jgi:peptidoglycan/xylan/chitin deacetylase (PgdA/CDA1 family)
VASKLRPKILGLSARISSVRYCGRKLILLPHYLNRAGRLNILFDVEPESYGDMAADADRIVEHVVAETRPGSIILLHITAESRTESRKAIPGIIRVAARRDTVSSRSPSYSPCHELFWRQHS